ncbi:MAG: hypothetical protein CVU00_03565 [Bacteroidetes bacterium HGW-Bacteroidetes-17]|jgi:hypothetical protein|nr:MAG: hypothetical protein CVU00_03565 [Bacteroidetes bacterium HGW-Bacteroidetes-17]
MKKYKEFFFFFLIAFLLSNLFFYFEEGIQTFKFYTNLSEVVMLIFITFFFTAFPIILFYGWKKSFLKSLLGFIPIVGFVFFIILENTH